jgi:hypothetical protein
MEYLSRGNEVVQAVHEFFNACIEIIPMDVEYVDVGGPQVLQRGIDRKHHVLWTITHKINLLTDGTVMFLPGRGELEKGWYMINIETGKTRLALVAITISSRFPLNSIHSPISNSEVLF